MLLFELFGKSDFLLNPFLPHPNWAHLRRERDIGSISEGWGRAAHGWRKILPKWLMSLTFALEALGSVPQLVLSIFLARTRAEWLGRRTQLLSGMFKARRSPLTKTSISHSRDPQVVSHQGTTHALIWSRWGANSEVGNLILYLVMGRGSQ